MSNVVAMAQPGSTELALPTRPGNVPAAIRIMMDEGLFARAQTLARMMAGAKGTVPAHLIGQEEACFQCVVEALDFGLNPYFLAQNTFPVVSWDPKTREETVTSIGQMSKVMRAKMEASGYFEWFEHEFHGDWAKVTGRFRWETNDRGKKKQVKDYTDADEAGLSITFRAKVKGRDKVDELTMDLRQMWPRNSTLWATDPMTQALYCVQRRFANIFAPHALGGMKYEDDFDPEAFPKVGPEHARDLNPRPAAPAQPIDLIDAYGEAFAIPAGEVEAWIKDHVAGATEEALQALLDGNEGVVELADAIEAERARIVPPKPAREPWIVRFADGRERNQCAGAGEAMRLYANGRDQADDKRAFAVANLSLLRRLAEVAKNGNRERLLQEIAAAEPGPDDDAPADDGQPSLIDD